MKRFSALILLLAFLLSAAVSCDIAKKKPGAETGDTAPVDTRSPNYDPAAVLGVKGKEYSLNNAAMTYLFNYHFGYFVANYYSYLSYFGLDPSKPLREQTQDPESGKTWYDYFMNDAVSSAKSMLALCDAAERFGVTWDADDDAYLLRLSDEIREAAHSSASGSPDEYIRASFGEDASFDAVLTVNRLSHFAGKVSDALYESLKISDEEINTYYEAHKSTYLVQPFYAYSFPKGTLDEDGLKALKGKADAAAAASHDPESFYEAILPYIQEEEETYTLSYYYNEVGYGGTSEAEVWLWDEARQAGDTTVIDSSSAYTLFLYFAGPKRDDSRTASVRHILLDGSDEETKKQAEEILADFLTDPTAEHFTTLAAEYTTDPGFQTVGDLYADLREGETVKAFNDWAFSSEREHGDTGIVLTEYGYHIMYFESFGDYLWRQDIANALRNQKAEEIMNPYFDAIETDDAVLSQVLSYFPE